MPCPGRGRHMPYPPWVLQRCKSPTEDSKKWPERCDRLRNSAVDRLREGLTERVAGCLLSAEVPDMDSCRSESLVPFVDLKRSTIGTHWCCGRARLG